MANDINISPDMINNLVNMFKNSSATSTDSTGSATSTNSTGSTGSTGSTTSTDFANFTDHADSANSSTSTENSGPEPEMNSIDFETIMKMKTIMETLNEKNDPRSNLIYSLKPYLRKSKQAKLDQYANLLKITQVSGLFKNKKGDSNNAN